MSYGQKSDFQDGGRRHLEFPKFQFLVMWLLSGSISDVEYQISSKSDNILTEIWRFNDFQNGSRPPSWILKICSFFSCSPRRHAVLLPHTKFRWNRTIGRWVMAKNRFSRWQPLPSWILKISIFCHVTVMGLNICCSVPNFIKIARFFTEIWWFSYLQNGGCPPSWICYDVTILHRRTQFRCPNIVLKFHVDLCCSLRDTCNIVSRPFGCK